MSRPITHTEHGQYGYAKRTKCDCDLCRTMTRRYDKARRIATHRGQSRRKDTTEVLQHIRSLMAGADVSPNRIAKATGGKVTESQVRRMLEGNQGKPVTWVYQPTIDALLAVTHRDIESTDGMVSSVGTRRRIAALHYMGYGMTDIAKLAGVTTEAVRGWTKRDTILASTVRRVRELYDTYSMVPGTNQTMRWRSYRTDQVSPMCWDDETIDDPDAEPDRSCLACVVSNCRRPPEAMSVCNSHLRQLKERGAIEDPNKFRYHVESMGRRRGTHNNIHLHEELADMKELGVTVTEAAHRSGYSPKYIEKVWGRVS